MNENQNQNSTLWNAAIDLSTVQNSKLCFTRLNFIKMISLVLDMY